MNSEPGAPDQYCSEHSRSVNEPLYGSAPRTDYWLLLEYPYPVASKALESSKLPDPLKRSLEDLQFTLRYSRLLLIRNKASTSSSNPTLFLADGREAQAKLFEIHLNSYMDILSLDIPQIFARGADSHLYHPEKRLIIVCTNGKRDSCCAKWGLPLYRNLAKQDGSTVWQSSHVGGHRFAPNLICLPHGIYYGRVPLMNAPQIYCDYQNGRLSLDCYRGRAAYPGPVQAAEYFLRLETKVDSVDTYRLDSYTPVGVDEWEVTFFARHEDRFYHLQIASELTGRSMYESCNAPSEKKPVKEFHLLRPVQSS